MAQYFKTVSNIFPHHNFLLFLSCVCLFSLDVLSFTLTLNQLSSIIQGSLFLLLPRWLPYGCYFPSLFPINTSFHFFSSVYLSSTKLVFICQFRLFFLQAASLILSCDNLILHEPTLVIFPPSLISPLSIFHQLFPFIFFASFLPAIVLVIFFCQLFLLI